MQLAWPTLAVCLAMSGVRVQKYAGGMCSCARVVHSCAGLLVHARWACARAWRACCACTPDVCARAWRTVWSRVSDVGALASDLLCEFV